MMKDIYIDQPLFSVIVPAYNSAAFLDTCVKSVLGQTCSDFELILVDDGSKDATPELCDAYAKADPRVKAFHKENGGHTSARNRGLEASVGEYVLFLDSDDWLSRETLAACQDEVLAHGSDIIVFNIKNSHVDTPLPVLAEAGYYDICDPKEPLWDDLLMNADGNFAIPRSLSAKCFKRDAILESQLSIPKDVIVGEDGAAFFGAMLRSQGVSLITGDGRACYHCLVRTDSVSRTADPKAFERLPALFAYYQRILSFVKRDFSEQFDRFVVAKL
jgi:glycosyltransferase involved in cell wall biosynthesis